MKTLILIALIVGAKGSFGASWFAYELPAVPKNAEGCAATAKTLAEAFGKSSGITVFRGTCERETPAGYDVSIQYRSEERYPVVSTALESGGLGYLGVYRTPAECAAALPEETKRFESATGLKLFIAYCYQDSTINRARYYVRIDGLGFGKKYPYRFEANVYGEIVGDAAALLKTLLTTAVSKGIEVYQTAVADDGGSTKVVVRYYDSPLNLLFQSRYFVQHEHDGVFDGDTTYYSNDPKETLRYCEEQRAEAQKGFDTAFGTPSIWFCSWDRLLFQARLNVVRVLPSATYTAELVPFRYPTFAECDGDRPAVAELYKQSLGKPPILTLCDWNSGLTTGKPDAYVIRALLPKVK